MATVYLGIVVFLLVLAVFDLTVGVSNDAVNFLNSAIGAKAAKYRTILCIASVGILVGAIMSNGMMDIARHGIMHPSSYTFNEVMTVFLAVIVTDVVILDMFNTMGLPTSTTVSMIFELLGGTFMLAVIKIAYDSTGALSFANLLNTDKALTVIIGIFLSVAIAFFFGTIVQWISRIVFTFNYKKHLRYTVAIFGGIAITSLSYCIFIQGLKQTPFLSADTKLWIVNNTTILMVYTFIGSTVLMEVLHRLHVNIFKSVVLMGTFSLAMAFAGNDLVNFIGVPLAGLSSYQDYVANANGMDPHSFMMNSLQATAKTPPFYLMAAGLIMVIAIKKKKKAHNVIKTSVDLARQEAGEEKFGSSG